jgi:hypothetical protein
MLCGEVLMNEALNPAMPHCHLEINPEMKSNPADYFE